MPTYEKIETITLGSSSGVVIFSSIPQTYHDLAVKISARSDNTLTDLKIRVNNDATANYSQIGQGGDGSGGTFTTGGSSLSQVSITNILDSSYTSGVFTSFDIYIGQYREARAKVIGTWSSSETNGTVARSLFLSGRYNPSTPAISELRFGPDVGNFIAGSVFSLYGISK